jgi:hypothetical protein
MNRTLLSITAIIAAVAMIGSMGAIALANAQTSGNPHSYDPDDIVKLNPQGKSVGNPHDVDEGQTHGNPHGGI